MRRTLFAILISGLLWFYGSDKTRSCLSSGSMSKSIKIHDNSVRQTPVEKTPTAGTANAIYSFVIDRIIFKSESNRTPNDTVLLEPATVRTNETAILNLEPNIRPELSNRLVEINASPAMADLGLDVHRPVERITALPRNINEISRLRAEFPSAKGSLGISRIALSDDGSQALLYLRFTNWAGAVDQWFAIVQLETPEKIWMVKFVNF